MLAHFPPMSKVLGLSQVRLISPKAGYTSRSLLLKHTSLCCYYQVALNVAEEFWEQGDLERTVLEQQPIVSMAAYAQLCLVSLTSFWQEQGLFLMSVSY